MGGAMQVERLTYSVQEAARALGLGKNRIYELVHQNRLRAVKVEKRILIPRTELYRFLGVAAGQNA